MREVADLLDQARWRLIEAEQSLDRRDQSWAFENETTLIHAATERITIALALLDREEEETCEKS
ncbi:hypothetical protein ES707_09609 [subsurface metagenome]